MMNEFTKEELEYLKKAIYERPSCITDEMIKMTLKLDEIIDELGKPCNHEWVKWPEWLTPTHNRCIKCDYRDEL